MKPLEIIARIDVGTAPEHQFVLEATAATLALARGKGDTNGGVVGTADSGRCELYGWLNPIAPHRDSGHGPHWIYGLILTKGSCESIATEDGTIIHPEVGDVFRLDDSVIHFTSGTGSTIAAFVNVEGDLDDERALLLLERGVRRLAAGVRTAPRVSAGFRTPLRGEVIATRDFEKHHIVSKKLADKRGWTIATCAKGDCTANAVVVDSAFPMFWDGNRCAKCYSAGQKHY